MTANSFKRNRLIVLFLLGFVFALLFVKVYQNTKDKYDYIRQHHPQTVVKIAKNIFELNSKETQQLKTDATKEIEKNEKKIEEKIIEEKQEEEKQGAGDMLAQDDSWIKIQHQRQQRLREFCAKKDLKKLPKPKYEHNWIYSDKARVSYCSIPKVACTTWKKIFQVFYGNYRTIQDIKVSKDDVHELKYQYHMGLNIYKANLKTEQYFNFIIVRHPLERLVSGYRNKIEKPFNANFQRRFGSLMLRFNRNNLTEQEYRAGKGVTFHEYINYIIKTPMNKIDEHFGGMQELCHICNTKYDFIADMSTLYDDSDIILKQIGWYDRLQFPKKSKDNYVKGAVDIAPEYINRLSDKILNKVYEKFRDDFEAFGYKFDIKEIRKGTFY
uniref:Carbohydrate sulfotransferase n=1 Tax=Clytia hemisphaerica TaxID=252671 RepID=A0A7M5XCY0_9CNID